VCASVGSWLESRRFPLLGLAVCLGRDIVGLAREHSWIEHAAHHDTNHDRIDIPRTSVKDSTKIPTRLGAVVKKVAWSGGWQLSVAYSITWSARCSRDGGIVNPRALAVLRLITSS